MSIPIISAAPKNQLPPALVKTIDSLPIASALILIGLLTEHCLRLSLISPPKAAA